MRLFWACACLLAWITTASAEPSSVVRFLMNQPVSVFDYGLIQLEEQFAEQHFYGIAKPVPLNTHAAYDWNANRIYLSFRIMIEEVNVSQSVLKDICESSIWHARTILGVGPDTGKLEDEVALGMLFEPRSFTVKDAPHNVNEELSAIIDLRSTVSTSDPKSKAVRCRGRLLNRETMFSD